MIKYLLRRILNWAFMIFLATNITYLLANFYLHPRSNFAERRPPLPEAQIDRNLDQLNLNDKMPIAGRWWTWLKNIVLHWDWGRSPDGQTKVVNEVANRIWVSGELLLGATILMILIGVSLGVYTASRQYKFADRFFQGFSIVAMNIHTVVAALGVQTLIINLNRFLQQSLHRPDFQLLYVTGSKSQDVHGFFPGLLDKLQHLTAPTISLVLVGYAGYHFTQRALLLDNIAADYVRTARAKGLTKAQAIRRHALRTSIIPIATSIAFSIPGLFTGAFLSEQIYAWQGMGKYFVDALGKNDIHATVIVSAFGALMTAIGAILSDIILVFVDPRVRVS